MIDRFLKWWLLIILILIGIGVAWNFEFFVFLHEKDFTNLGLFTLFVFIVNSTTTGIKIFKESKDYEVEWFCSDAVVSIGMIGTVIGFIYMLFSVFSDLNLGDSAQMMMALSEMAKGMSTALLTTLVGLISSVLLKFQLVIAQK
jgi:hypothetical protein